MSVCQDHLGPAKYRTFGESVRKLCPRWRLGEMFGPLKSCWPPRSHFMARCLG